MLRGGTCTALVMRPLTFLARCAAAQLLQGRDKLIEAARR
jgi:hypothetical protein